MKEIHEWLTLINEHIVPKLTQRLGEDDRDINRLQNALNLLTDAVHEQEPKYGPEPTEEKKAGPVAVPDTKPETEDEPEPEVEAVDEAGETGFFDEY